MKKKKKKKKKYAWLHIMFCNVKGKYNKTQIKFLHRLHVKEKSSVNIHRDVVRIFHEWGLVYQPKFFHENSKLYPYSINKTSTI